MCLETANTTRMRSVAKRVPGLKQLYRQLRQRKADGREALDVLRLRAVARRGAFEGDSSSNVVVSLTSFPVRAKWSLTPFFSSWNISQISIATPGILLLARLAISLFLLRLNRYRLVIMQDSIRGS